MPKAAGMQIKLWGVRGSIPTPGPDTVEFGGNTPCVEVLVKGQRLIFDGGSGMRNLGLSLLSQMPVQGQLFLSHYHWDHIQGFPFFTPGYVPGNYFRIYGPVTPDGITVERVCQYHMQKPNFPVPLSLMSSLKEFNSVKPGDVLEENGVKVIVRKLNHSPESVGYRVESDGLVFAYLSDYEHVPDRLDPEVIALAQDADLVIYDGMYTDEEYNHPKNSKRGWGHSTWQEGVKLAKACRVKKLVIFHHDPTHSDAFMRALETTIQETHPSAIIGREGLTITL